MTDNPESTPGTEPVVPPSTSTSPPADSPPSGSPDVGSLVSAILEHPDFQKKTQSVKDKRIAEIQTSLGEQDQQIARLAKALGVEPQQVKQAQDKMAMDDLLNAYQNGTLGKPPVPDTKPPGSGVDLAKARQSIIASTGLPETHPGLDDFIAEQDWSNPIDAATKVTTWAAEQKASIKQPTASDTAPMSTGAATSTLGAMKVEDIGDEMIKLQQDPRKNRARITELDKELERRDK